jgi:hypothetical protein
MEFLIAAACGMWLIVGLGVLYMLVEAMSGRDV